MVALDPGVPPTAPVAVPPAALPIVQATTTRSPVFKSPRAAPAVSPTLTVVVLPAAAAPVVASVEPAVPPTALSRSVTVRAVASTATTSAANSPEIAPVGALVVGDA
jgi:hypothetical protein